MTRAPAFKRHSTEALDRVGLARTRRADDRIAIVERVCGKNRSLYFAARPFAPRVSSVLREDLAGIGPPPLPSCAPVAPMLLEEKIDRLLAERLGARLEIKSEFAELAPSDRVEIN